MHLLLLILLFTSIVFNLYFIWKAPTGAMPDDVKRLCDIHRKQLQDKDKFLAEGAQKIAKLIEDLSTRTIKLQASSATDPDWVKIGDRSFYGSPEQIEANYRAIFAAYPNHLICAKFTVYNGKIDKTSGDYTQFIKNVSYGPAETIVAALKGAAESLLGGRGTFVKLELWVQPSITSSVIEPKVKVVKVYYPAATPKEYAQIFLPESHYLKEEPLDQVVAKELKELEAEGWKVER